MSFTNPDKNHTGKTEEATRARFMAYYIMHELYRNELNLTQIANAFGRKHNASVAPGINLIKSEVLKDKSFALKLFEVINNFKQMFGDQK